MQSKNRTAPRAGRDLFHVKSFVVQKVAHVMPSIFFLPFFHDLFIFSINYTENKGRKEEQQQPAETRAGLEIVIIRWQKKLRLK